MLRLHCWKRNGGLGSVYKKSSCQFFMFRSSDDLEKATIASEDIRRSLLNSVS